MMMMMVYIVNNIGPNTDPWGTPHARGLCSEMASPILTLCVRGRVDKGVGHLDHVRSYGVREVVSSIPDRGNIVG